MHAITGLNAADGVQTTLLKVLAGKHMVAKDQCTILGSPPFYATHLTVAGQLSYIGGNWERDIAFAGYSIPLAGDFPASQMLDSIHNVSAERRRKLVEVLDIDETWRMHLVSDGQRRRVQIACGLLKPADVLLLDEVTVRSCSPLTACVMIPSSTVPVIMLSHAYIGIQYILLQSEW